MRSYDAFNYGGATVFQDTDCQGSSAQVQVLSAKGLGRREFNSNDFEEETQIGVTTIASVMINEGYAIDIYSQDEFQGKKTAIYGGYWLDK